MLCSIANSFGAQMGTVSARILLSLVCEFAAGLSDILARRQFNNMQPSVWWDSEDNKTKAWYNTFSTCVPPGSKSCGGRGTKPTVCDSNMGLDSHGRTGSLCYAESDSRGLNWSKPSLGLVGFGKIPASETNIVLGDAVSPHQPLSGAYPTGNGITLNENANESQKWLMLGAKQMYSAYVATSPDGKRWSAGMPMPYGRWDTHLNLQRDVYSGRWMGFGRDAHTAIKWQALLRSAPAIRVVI